MLFRSIRIGPFAVPNRICRSATCERAAIDGRPTADLRNILVALAEGGATWIDTGFAYVQENGRSIADQSGIHRDDLVPVWRDIANAVHAANRETKLFMQLVHGGRQVAPEVVDDVVAPSAVPCPAFGTNPRAMSEREIEECLEAFAAAARRSREAGFDGVQLHAAHGFLIGQFLSPYTNRRADGWGGTPERRRRFLLEAYRRARAASGKGCAVTCKLNAEDCLPGGLVDAESSEAVRALNDEGIDAIEVSAWVADADPALSPSRPGDPTPEKEGYFVAQAVRLKKSAPDTPVGVCGGLRSVDAMEYALCREGLDFVALSRPFVATPDLVRRLRGKSRRAVCTSCNRCGDPKIAPLYCPPMAEGRLTP